MEEWDPAAPVSEFLRSRAEEIETYVMDLNERIEVSTRTLAELTSERNQCRAALDRFAEAAKKLESSPC